MTTSLDGLQRQIKDAIHLHRFYAGLRTSHEARDKFVFNNFSREDIEKLPPYNRKTRTIFIGGIKHTYRPIFGASPATYYVGPGGNDGNNGLTWALRKLTLNGVEDIPVVAADVAYVGPGVYRERLTVDVSGAGGSIITYIGDVSGENTDDVGGIVRITGSDNDQTTARNACIISNAKDYRTFRGFKLDITSAYGISESNGGDHWIVEDCIFADNANSALILQGANQSDWIIRRCLFLPGAQNVPQIFFSHAATVDDCDHVVENCIVFGVRSQAGIRSDRIGGIAIRNVLVFGCDRGIRIQQALAGGQTVDVENSIIISCGTALQSVNLGDLVEDYNTLFNNGTDRTNVNVGANSETYPPLLLPPILHSGVGQISGFEFPWWFGKLSEWSQVRAITGSNEPTEDLLGIARPVTASKNSWGPVQFPDMERETGTVRTGSVSMVLHDAGRHQIWVPVTATSTTIEVYVYREANYAGNLPQMIIKQPGQADDVTTDVGAAGGWNQLTTTLVPAADPPYVVVELVSRNTAVALAYKTFFDDLDVS